MKTEFYTSLYKVLNEVRSLEPTNEWQKALDLYFCNKAFDHDFLFIDRPIWYPTMRKGLPLITPWDVFPELPKARMPQDVKVCMKAILDPYTETVDLFRWLIRGYAFKYGPEILANNQVVLDAIGDPISHTGDPLNQLAESYTTGASGLYFLSAKSQLCIAAIIHKFIADFLRRSSEFELSQAAKLLADQSPILSTAKYGAFKPEWRLPFCQLVENLPLADTLIRY